jgi:hypothetical protein
MRPLPRDGQSSLRVLVRPNLLRYEASINHRRPE